MTCSISQKVGESLPFVYVSPVSNQFETSVNRLVSAVAECDLSECSSSFGELVKSVTVDQINAAVEDLIKCGKVLPFDVSYLSPVGYVFGVRVLYALSSVGGAIGYVADRGLAECQNYCCNDGDDVQYLKSVVIESHVLDTLLHLVKWYKSRSDVLEEKLRSYGNIDLSDIDTMTDWLVVEERIIDSDTRGMIGGISAEYIAERMKG